MHANYEVTKADSTSWNQAVDITEDSCTAQQALKFRTLTLAYARVGVCNFAEISFHNVPLAQIGNAMDKDMKPPQFTDAMDETAIMLLMMKWLNERGMAVVVFTKAELRGVDADDLEGTLIEGGNEVIYALTGEMNTSDEDSTEEETQ